MKMSAPCRLTTAVTELSAQIQWMATTALVRMVMMAMDSVAMVTVVCVFHMFSVYFMVLLTHLYKMGWYLSSV